MTYPEINMAVATVLGWKDCQPSDRGGEVGCTEHNPLLRQLPDYVEDLDAMHEAEKTLVVREISHYEVYLREVVAGKAGFWYTPHTGEVFAVAHATARQRAEAFLRVHGAWKEGQ